jgi:diadenosine tetraphosphate (Ap4A) HIT family hydrolase
MSCLACDTVGPGGVIAETEGWLVDHCVGPLGVGTLIVKPKRHVLHVAELTEAEAAELGPILQKVSDAVTTLVQPEQVYVTLWSHAGGAPGHIHFVVQPVTQERRAAFGGEYGPRLQVSMFERGDTPDPDAAAAFAADARELLR